VKLRDEYKDVRVLPSALVAAQSGTVGLVKPGQKAITAGRKSTLQITV